MSDDFTKEGKIAKAVSFRLAELISRKLADLAGARRPYEATALSTTAYVVAYSVDISRGENWHAIGLCVSVSSVKTLYTARVIVNGRDFFMPVNALTDAACKDAADKSVAIIKEWFVDDGTGKPFMMQKAGSVRSLAPKGVQGCLFDAYYVGVGA